MTLLKWLWTESGNEIQPPPHLVYYVLRVGMFVLSFVLEDWAIYELMPSPRRRRQAVVLVASSYVTWTFQTHTFSNALETLLVLWSLVLIQRILDNRVCSFFLFPSPACSFNLTNMVCPAVIIYICLHHSFFCRRCWCL